jgi:hypothetical protein
MTLLRRWVLGNGVGELLGLGVGTALGVPLQLWLEQRIPLLPAVVLAAVVFALVEGLAVGGAQWRVLRLLAPEVGARRWLATTMAGGLTAWLAVSVPLALAQPGPGGAAAPQPPLALQLVAMSLVGLAAGPVLGGWQALALRRVVRRPWPWLWANAKAWAVGMPVIQLGAGGTPAGTPLAVVVALAAVTLFTAGCLVGRIHGPTLLRLTGHPEGT